MLTPMIFVFIANKIVISCKITTTFVFVISCTTIFMTNSRTYYMSSHIITRRNWNLSYFESPNNSCTIVPIINNSIRLETIFTIPLMYSTMFNPSLIFIDNISTYFSILFLSSKTCLVHVKFLLGNLTSFFVKSSKLFIPNLKNILVNSSCLSLTKIDEL